MTTTSSAGAPRLAAVLLMTALAISACGGDDAGGSEGAATSPTTSATQATDDSRCAVVSEEALSEATATDQTLQTPREQGETTSCRTMVDGNGMSIEWDVRAARSTFEEVGLAADLPGVEREQVEVEGTPAWMVEGTVSGTRLAIVAMLVEEEELSVQASDLGDSSAAVTPDQLRAGALAVADLYAAG